MPVLSIICFSAEFQLLKHPPRKTVFPGSARKTKMCRRFGDLGEELVWLLFFTISPPGGYLYNSMYNLCCKFIEKLNPVSSWGYNAKSNFQLINNVGEVLSLQLQKRSRYKINNILTVFIREGIETIPFFSYINFTLKRGIDEKSYN